MAQSMAPPCVHRLSATSGLNHRGSVESATSQRMSLGSVISGSSFGSVISGQIGKQLPTLLQSAATLKRNTSTESTVLEAAAKLKKNVSESKRNNLGSLGVLFNAKVTREAEKDEREEKGRPRRRSLPTLDAADDESPALLQGKVLLKSFKFFQKLPLRIQSNLLSVVHHASRSAGSLLFEQGDKPEECYVILTGSVGIHVRSEDDLPDGSQVGDKSDATSEEDKEEDVDENDPVVKYGRQVAVLGSGSLFGEVAIIKGQPRNATCACVENSEFLYIGIADFERVLKKDMEAFKDDKIEWLEKHIPGVRLIAERRLELVALNFSVASYPKGHVFIQQGTRTDERVYLVRKGCVEIRCRENGNVFSSALHHNEVSSKLSVVVEGGLFGSSACGGVEPFSYIVSKTPCEVFEACRGNFGRLPLSVRLAVRENLTRSTRWHHQSRTVADPRGNITPRPYNRKPRSSTEQQTILLRDHGKVSELDFNTFSDMVPLAAVGLPHNLRKSISLPTITESRTRNNRKIVARRDESISHRSTAPTTITHKSSQPPSSHQMSSWSIGSLPMEPSTSSLEDFIRSRQASKKEAMTMTTSMNSMRLPATSMTVVLNSKSLPLVDVLDY